MWVLPEFADSGRAVVQGTQKKISLEGGIIRVICLEL